MTSCEQLDLTGGHLDLLVVNGRDVAFELPTPSNLSGYTWAGMIRATADDPDLLGSFVITVDATTAILRLVAATTTALPSRCFYEVTVTRAEDAGTLEYSLLSGAINCVRGVVRP